MTGGVIIYRTLKVIFLATLVLAFLLVKPYRVERAEASPALVLRLLVIAGLRNQTAKRLGKGATAIRVARFARAFDRISGGDGIFSQLLRPAEAGQREIQTIAYNIETSIAHMDGRLHIDNCGPLRAFGHEDGSISVAYCVQNALAVSESEQRQLLQDALAMLRNNTRTVGATLCAPRSDDVYSEAYYNKSFFDAPCSGIAKSRTWEANLILHGQPSKGRKY